MTASDDFWTARASWISAHQTAQTAALRSGVTIPMDRKAAQWAGRGGYYLRKTGLKAEIITVDPKLSADMQRLIDQLAPSLGAAMDAHLGPLAQEVFDTWPTETGLSKSLINLEYYVDGGNFVGAIESRAPYTVFIREPGKTKEDPDAEKKREKARAIRAAAIAAGKEASLISNKGGSTASGNRSGGKQIYKVLIADRGRATAEAIGVDSIERFGKLDGQ